MTDLRELGLAMRDAQKRYFSVPAYETNHTRLEMIAAQDAFDKALNEPPAALVSVGDSAAVMLLREVSIQAVALPSDPRFSAIDSELVGRIDAFLPAPAPKGGE
jgi:hypothetical protein